MREYFSQALDAFPVFGKEVTLWNPSPPWCQKMLLQKGASLGKQKLDAFVLLSELKKMKEDQDLAAMNFAKSLLKPEGLLYLSIPIGQEKNLGSHRVYGEKRMKDLFKGWRPIGYFGYSYEDLLNDPIDIHEPVFVLKAK